MWLLFGAPFPVIAALSALEALILSRARGMIYPAIVSGLFSSIHLSWLRTARLTLGDSFVTYRALFVRKELKLSEVVRAKFEFGRKGLGPMQRIVFQVHTGEKPRTVTINAGLFDGRRSKQWVDTLDARLAEANGFSSTPAGARH